MGEGLRLAEEKGELPDLALTHFRYAELLQRRVNGLHVNHHRLQQRFRGIVGSQPSKVE